MTLPPARASAAAMLDWLPGGEPGPGRIARIHLKTRQDAALLEEAFSAESLLPALTVYDCIAAAAAAVPESKPAIVHLRSADGSIPPRVISYGELIAQMARVANLCVDASAGEPVSIATILPMVPEALVTVWGAAAAGLSTPINPYLENHYIVSIMNAARTTVLVTSPDAFDQEGMKRIAEIVGQVPSIKRVLIVDANDPLNDFASAIAKYPATLNFKSVTDPDADVCYQLTGGTTATPKLCRLTHRGQLINAWLNGALQGCETQGVVAHAMPNFHIGGAVVVALRTVLFSQTLVTLTRDGYRNQDVISHFWAIARQNGITKLLATPTTAAAILAATGDATGHSVSAFACGGSTVPLALNQAFHERFGVWLREQWGLSEAQGTVTGHFRDGQEPVAGSVGQVFAYYRLMAIEVDEANVFLRECEPGERGVLAVSGPVTPGYVDSALDSALFIRDMPDGGIWVNSGDLGTIDESGLVWIFGRAKDLIVRGGHNIDPKLIEDVLISHPAVQVAAAVGRPDPSKGEMPIAYVQLVAGAEIGKEDLITFCRSRVQERASAPVDIIMIDAMPLTPVGKISKPELRRDALVRCARDVIGGILGKECEAVISIDESGRRPRVVVRLSGGTSPEMVTTIDRAFAGYEFSTTIVPETVK